MKFIILQKLTRLLNIFCENTIGYAFWCWYQYRWCMIYFPQVSVFSKLIKFQFVYRWMISKYFLIWECLFKQKFLVSFWFVQKFLSTKICHEDGVKNIQRQVLEWRKSGMKQKMCTARPSWKSISLQNLTYKDTSYKVRSYL